MSDHNVEYELNKPFDTADGRKAVRCKTREGKIVTVYFDNVELTKELTNEW